MNVNNMTFITKCHENVFSVFREGVLKKGTD